jgi:hypothetical protein
MYCGFVRFALLEFRGELAIRVDDEHIIRRILKTLEEDWANSHPMDLSDEGLVAELKKHDPNVREDLGIGDSKHKKRKRAVAVGRFLKATTVIVHENT